MKKLLIFFTFISILTVNTYSETILTTPSVGYDFLVYGDVSGKNYIPIHGIHIGLNVGYIFENGYTFLFNTGGSIFFPEPSTYMFSIPLQFLHGYTFRSSDDKLHFMIGSGLGMSIMPYVSFDIPLHLSFDYYFNNKYGINLTINEAFGIDTLLLMFREWVIKNSLKISIGPKFKF